MRYLAAILSFQVLVGCYGSIPPEPPCIDQISSDSVPVETRILRDMSRRPKKVWHVRQDSTGSWIQHGRSIHYFLNGQVSAIEWYRNGKLEGAASYWHQNGAKQGEIAYVRGVPNGVARTWYDDGTIESEKQWNMGHLERWIKFDRRGKLIPASPTSGTSRDTTPSPNPITP